MFAFGANFSTEADSHLVCIQEGENYKTQAINIQNKTRKGTEPVFTCTCIKVPYSKKTKTETYLINELT